MMGLGQLVVAKESTGEQVIAGDRRSMKGSRLKPVGGFAVFQQSEGCYSLRKDGRTFCESGFLRRQEGPVSLIGVLGTTDWLAG